MYECNALVCVELLFILSHNHNVITKVNKIYKCTHIKICAVYIVEYTTIVWAIQVMNNA